MCSIRNLWRTYRIYSWEVEQAEEWGWIQISAIKPRVGRPSRIAANLSNYGVAEFPLWRHQIPKKLSYRQLRFALESTNVIDGGGAVRAYQVVYPCAKSRAGAAASASRLMKDPMIRAARLWFQSYDRYPHDEVMPTTPMGIYMRLAKLRAENEKRRQRHRSLVV